MSMLSLASSIISTADQISNSCISQADSQSLATMVLQNCSQNNNRRRTIYLIHIRILFCSLIVNKYLVSECDFYNLNLACICTMSCYLFCDFTIQNRWHTKIFFRFFFIQQDVIQPTSESWIILTFIHYIKHHHISYFLEVQ